MGTSVEPSPRHSNLFPRAEEWVDVKHWVGPIADPGDDLELQEPPHHEQAAVSPFSQRSCRARLLGSHHRAHGATLRDGEQDLVAEPHADELRVGAQDRRRRLRRRHRHLHPE
jgi:hypothetical protein